MPVTPGPRYHGQFWCEGNNRLSLYHASNDAATNAVEYIRITTSGVDVRTCGLTVTAGGLTVTAGGATVTAGGLTVSACTAILPAGTEAAPSLAFACDPDTGIFRAAADAVGITAGGVELITAIESTQDEVVINEDGDDVDFRVESDCVTNLFLVCGAADNMKVGGTAAHATTPGTQSISIFSGTAPNGTLACGATLFAGCDTCVIEIRAEDSGGTATTL